MRTGSSVDRRIVVAAATVAVAAAVILAAVPDSTVPVPERSNVVLISIDPLRPDHLQCNGYHRETAPNICALAGESVVFPDAFSDATWTLPAYASMLTGRYPSDHGVYYRNRSIDRDMTVFPAELKAAGYTTAAFVGSRPGVGDLRPKFGFDRGFDTYTGNGLYLQGAVPAARRWLNESPDEPFFLWVQGYEPHSPYKVPSHTDMFDPDYDGIVNQLHINDVSRIRQGADGPVLTGNGSTVPLSRADIEHFVAEYDEQVHTADRQVGRLLDHLRGSGELNDTVIILTSAHGETLADRVLPSGALFGHGSVYEENARIPMIVRIPGVGHRTVERPVTLQDIMPTLLSIAGRAPRTDARGLFATGERGPLFLESPRNDIYAVRDGHWKYIDRSRALGRDELYDLSSDPGETENVIDRYPDIAGALHDRIETHRLENLP